MPREIFELTPPQLDWLIDNQSLSLTTGQALHESAKMGWLNAGTERNLDAEFFNGYRPHNYHGTSKGEFEHPYGSAMNDGNTYHESTYPTQHHSHHLDHHMEDVHHHKQLETPSSSDHDDRSPLQDAREFFKNEVGSSIDLDGDQCTPMCDDDDDDNNNTSNAKPAAKQKELNPALGHEDPYKHRIGKLTWEQSFENLKVYEEINGHCNVPRYFNDHPQLGSWVHRQRLKRKSPKKYGFLSPDQVNQLSRLGFCWQLRGEGKEQFVPQQPKSSKPSLVTSESKVPDHSNKANNV